MHHTLAPLLFALSASASVLPRHPDGDSSPPSNSCPQSLKSVTFNAGYDVNQFDKIGAADRWISFGLDIQGTPSDKAAAAHIPMMAFDSHVDAAVALVNSDNAPDWMLTFNEPDFPYGGSSPTMTPQQAADSIQRLLKSPGTKTKFVAPVTAVDQNWLFEFFDKCGCKDFFSAYNLHIYQPTLQGVTDVLSNFRKGFGDKPLWITEIAPGGANPSCSVGWDAAKDFMSGVYSFAKNSGYIDRVFWNTGNQIDGSDTNVCNSYLLDTGNNPSPLLDHFQSVGCD